MALTIGSQLGSHEITALLGKGGMGEVYRARDLKLKRDVAIKVLPPEFSRDADRIRRLQREAEVLAALNHIHIGAIYAVEYFNGAPCLVLEFVEGVTLADRIARGPLPVEEALAIAGQIAEALEAAHAKGIVHRDLKPANIKLTRDGRIKVLDFGLAKTGPMVGADLSSAPTISPSESGMILGTPAYMSPEQAKGEDTDRLTDIWAFGCVVYEMFSGFRRFEGNTAAEVLASVLKSAPDWSRLPPETPEGIRSLLRRCLERNRSDRLRDIGDARIEIGEVQSDPKIEGHHPAKEVQIWRRPIWVLATALLVIVAGVVGRVSRLTVQPDELRFEISTPMTDSGVNLAISPNGKMITFVADTDGRSILWLRSLDSESSVPFPGTDFATSPFWSPDNQSIGYYIDGKLQAVDIHGGAPRLLTAANLGFGSWNKEGTLLFSQRGIRSLPARGGPPTPVTDLVGNQAEHFFPTFLPDGRHFLYFVSGTGETSGVFLADLVHSPPRRLLDSDSRALFCSGYLLFGRKGTLYAQAFDLDRFELRGDSFPVVEGIGMGPGGVLGVSASDDGTIVYRRTPAGNPQRQFVLFDRKGNEQKLGMPIDVTAGSLSFDGRHVAFSQSQNKNSDIYVLDVKRGNIDRLTTNPATEIYPVYSPARTQFAFASNRKGNFDLYRSSVSTPDKAELLVSPGAPSDWSGDGRYLLYTGGFPKSAGVFVLPIDESGKPGPPQTVVDTDATERDGQFSPDGKWIAYTSDKSGRWEIYAQSFPVSGAAIPISVGGGRHARWSADGKQIFYVAPDRKLTEVPIQINSESELTAGTPIALFDSRISLLDSINTQPYVVLGSQEFLVATYVGTQAPPITILMNWKQKPMEQRK